MRFPADLKPFLILFLSFGLISFGIHSGLQSAFGSGAWSHQIITAYLLNFGIGVILISVISKLLPPESSALGFVFLSASALKFTLFYVLLRPGYKVDEGFDGGAFLAFFVPYFTCLLAEVLFLAKRLNNL